MSRHGNRWLRRAALTMLLALLGAAAVAQEQPADEYRLAVGDRVKVTVYGHEDLSGEFEVDASGDVSLPLINEIPAAGRSLDELEAAIVDALQPDYLIQPRVSVELLSLRPVYVLGEVEAPGSYPFHSGMTVVNAIAEAGGFTYRARRNRIRIVRSGKDGDVELQAELNTPLQPGDVIEIPERFF